MAYATKTVANTLLQRAFKEGRQDMTPMKLQKLMFFLNGWHLAVTGKPVIEEPFEAWKYGPVLTSVYHDVKQFGGGPISSYLKRYDSSTQTWKAFVVPDADAEFTDILDLTWEKYIGIDAIRLSAMTHAPGSPWDIVYKQSQKTGSTIIPNDLTKNYFIGLARAGSPATVSHA